MVRVAADVSSAVSVVLVRSVNAAAQPDRRSGLAGDGFGGFGDLEARLKPAQGPKALSTQQPTEVRGKQDSCDVITTVQREISLQGGSRPTLQAYKSVCPEPLSRRRTKHATVLYCPDSAL